MIKVAVNESATHEFTIDKLSPTKVATDECAVLKFRAPYNGFLKADIGERASLEAALSDLLLVELRTPEDAVVALEWFRKRRDPLSAKIGR